MNNRRKQETTQQQKCKDNDDDEEETTKKRKMEPSILISNFASLCFIHAATTVSSTINIRIDISIPIPINDWNKTNEDLVITIKSCV